jgi:hypothetical protein
MQQPSFSLSIPEPCTENWAQMSPCEQGRFCNSCQKTVVDFTGYTDAQLVAFFSNPAHVVTCGLYRTKQLNRPLLVHQPQSLIYRWILAVGFAAITLTAVSVQAQPNQLHTPFLSEHPLESAEFIQYPDSNKKRTQLPAVSAMDTVLAEQSGLTLGGGILTLYNVIIIDGIRGMSRDPEPPLIQVPTTQTYSGQEWDRRHQSLSELGTQ